MGGFFDILEKLFLGTFKLLGNVFKPIGRLFQKVNSARKIEKDWQKWKKKENERYRRQNKLNDEIN